MAAEVLQVDRDQLSPATIAKHARETQARRIMVISANRKTELLDVPQSNRHDGFVKRIAELGTPERVVWLNDEGMRISEMAAIAAAASAHAQANTEVSLLSVRQIGELFNTQAQIVLRNFSDIVGPVVKQSGDQANALRWTLQANAQEITLLRKENRELQRSIAALQAEATKLRIQVVEVSGSTEQKDKDSLTQALKAFGDKCAEFLMLAVGDSIDLPEGE